MVSLHFQMNLNPADTLLTGTLLLLEDNAVRRSFVATSGLPSYQTLAYEPYRRKGPIPQNAQVAFTSYWVETKPDPQPNVPGIEGNFYVIHPLSVEIEGVWRGEFGIHRDANVPGSAGCIVLRRSSEWRLFETLMAEYRNRGIDRISLKVEYNHCLAYPRVVSDRNPPLNVRSGPGTSFSILETLANETLITVADNNSQGWLQISDPISGWVSEELTSSAVFPQPVVAG